VSNAEYDATVRDLTGVDIRPTRTLPVDPANEAGFDNSGESLAMSPALLKKYHGEWRARVRGDVARFNTRSSGKPQGCSANDAGKLESCKDRSRS